MQQQSRRLRQRQDAPTEEREVQRPAHAPRRHLFGSPQSWAVDWGVMAAVWSVMVDVAVRTQGAHVVDGDALERALLFGVAGAATGTVTNLSLGFFRKRLAPHELALLVTGGTLVGFLGLLSLLLATQAPVEAALSWRVVHRIALAFLQVMVLVGGATFSWLPYAVLRSQPWPRWPFLLGWPALLTAALWLVA